MQRNNWIWGAAAAVVLIALVWWIGGRGTGPATAPPAEAPAATEQQPAPATPPEQPKTP